MPAARLGAVVGVIGGKLYVAGGWDGVDPFFSGALRVYDPATGTWTTKATMPVPVITATAGVIDGRLYVAGGSTGGTGGGTEVASLQVYDPASDTWALRTPMPVANALTVSGVIDGKLYVTGGTLNDNDNALRVYDPVADTWADRTPMSDAGAGMAAGVIDGKLYVTGGSAPPCSFEHVPNCMIYGTLRVYDPATDTWDETRSPMPTPRYIHTVAVLNGQLHAIGGDLGDVVGPAGAGTASHEVYDPSSDTWTTDTPMTRARYMLVADVINGRLYAAGGAAAGVPSIDVLEVYTPASPQYSTTAGHAFLQPINLPPQSQSVFKIGSTIPVKFKLFAADGVTPVSTAVATIQVNKVSSGVPSGTTEPVVSTVPNQGINFRYDLASQQYIFNLGTKGWTVGVYRITALLDDGSEITVDVGAR
jgi:N-acetylneuraminic acid mutarotase